MLQSIWQDLKSRKLLPVAAILLVAIVAVPIVVSGSSSAPTSTTPTTAPGVTAAGLPAVNETSVPSNAPPKGHVHNPFAPASGHGSAPTTTTTTTTTTTPPAGGSTSGTTGSPGSSSTSTTTTGGTSPTSPSSSNGGSPSGSPTPTPKPKTTTPALSAEQSYDVSLSITNSKGGVNTTSALERLSPLPSATQPLVVELGVLKGGSRVLFAVQPGTVVSGPGTCVPGSIDCEILSLAQGQTETLKVQTATGGPVQVGLFAVTGIRTVNHSSHSAALKARNQESRTGRGVLNHDHSSLQALSLFRYEPSVGAVVDLRNLTLGNS